MTFKATILAGAAAAALTLGAALPASAQDTQTVRFAMPSVGMLYLPVYVADVMGYFEDEGLEAELQVFKAGGGTAMAAVIGGDMDVYPGSSSAALRAVEQGTDVVIAGSLMTQYASNVVMRREFAEEKGITEESSLEEKLAALEGANIGVTGAGSGTHQLALYMLTQAGLDPERDATVVFVGGSQEVIAAFSQDRIDAFNMSNPTSDTAIRDHDGMLLFNTAAGEFEDLDGFLYISLNTTRSWIEEDRERAVSMVRAVAEAQAAMHDPERTEQARDAVFEEYFSQFDKDLFDTAWEAVVPAYPETPEVTAGQVEQVVDFLNEFSEDEYDVNVEDAFTNDLVEEALAAN